MNADAPQMTSALGEVGAAFKQDVIDPLASIATSTDGLDGDAAKINAFKESVIDGLGGIKELLDTTKAVFEEVNEVSDAAQQWSKWAGGIVPGLQSSIDPNRGKDGPGTIDPSLPVVSTPVGRLLYRM
jgi:hypothetical protein